MSHTAHDLTAVINRVASFLDEGVLPYAPMEEDTTPELLALRVALKGVNTPRGEPSGGLIEALRELVIGLEAELNLRMDSEITEVGDFVVERKPASYRYNWDHRSAAEEVATKAVFEEAVQHDGELPNAARAAQVVVDALLRFGAFSYWRVGEGDKAEIPLRKMRHSTGEVSSPAGVYVRRISNAEEDVA
jgi:hypothetical protein